MMDTSRILTDNTIKKIINGEIKLVDLHLSQNEWDRALKEIRDYTMNQQQNEEKQNNKQLLQENGVSVR